MQNPFESGHIKNYVLLYASVVVIMVLFFIATTLFNDVQKVEKKVFNTTMPLQEKQVDVNSTKEEKSRKFKLMESSY